MNRVADKKDYGLFFISNPVLEINGELFFTDRCYAETITHTQDIVPSSLIVARKRKLLSNNGFYPKLSDVGAKLQVPLEDYVKGGRRGISQIVRMIGSATFRRNLTALIKKAEFVFIDGGTSYEAYLAARISQRLKKRVFLEMRGSTVLNKTYMLKRFVLLGLVLVILHKKILAYVQRRSFAGLYINRKLMSRYPVAGDLMCAISDAYMPANICTEFKHFSAPARNYLYVGHLELVKRVDLIIAALNTIRDQLPKDWHLEIVGSGPSERNLREFSKKNGLSNHIHFKGRIEWGEQLFKYYRRADLLLISSMTESGPRVMIEAMSFGVPVLSTDVGLASEVLNNSVLVKINDKKSYAKSILSLIYDPVRLTRISNENWQRSQEFKYELLSARRKMFWRHALTSG